MLTPAFSATALVVYPGKPCFSRMRSRGFEDDGHCFDGTGLGRCFPGLQGFGRGGFFHRECEYFM